MADTAGAVRDLGEIPPSEAAPEARSGKADPAMARLPLLQVIILEALSGDSCGICGALAGHRCETMGFHKFSSHASCVYLSTHAPEWSSTNFAWAAPNPENPPSQAGTGLNWNWSVLHA